MTAEQLDAWQAIAAEIFSMSEVDQQMRMSRVWDSTVDLRNTRRMKEIVQQMGWPTRTKVGAEASHQAWLLVQHADHDRQFQEHCLALMKAEALNEVSAADIAYLEDRVRVKSGQPQLYATQFFVAATGAFGPGPIEDQENVDERRKAVGLVPLAEYMTVMHQIYQDRSILVGTGIAGEK